MGLLRRLFGRKRDKTAPTIGYSKQTPIPWKVGESLLTKLMDVEVYRGETKERVKVVAAYQFQNSDIIYGIMKWDNNLYAAVILHYPSGTIKEWMQGKSTSHSRQVEVVEVGPDVNVKYKEIGAFSPWPKPITKETKNL